MRKFVLVFAIALAAAACGQTPQEPAAPSETALPPLSELSPRDLLIECAGAITAQNALDPMADPTLGTAAENVYFTVLALMDKEPGLEGQAGRQAARVARDAWLERSAAARAQRAGECMTRFGP